MDDDFNTGSAIATLFDLVRLANKYVDSERLEVAAQPTAEQTENARTNRPHIARTGRHARPVPQTGRAKSLGRRRAGRADLMELLIELRAAARKNKDFATADKIRQRLTALEITLEDRPGGTEWTKA